MTTSRSRTPLLLGILLVALGGLLFVHNLLHLRLNWVVGLKYTIPWLLVLVGIRRLWCHYRGDPLRKTPRSGLLSGLFFTAIGMIWFFHLLGVLDFVAFVGLFWPLLLVLFGLGKIVDFYRFKGRLHVRPTEVLGLMFVVLFGFICSQLPRAHFLLRPLDLNLSLLGEDFSLADLVADNSFNHSTRESYRSEGVERIEIRNIHGDVHLRPSGGPSVEVELSSEVHARGRDRARELAQQIEIVFKRDGSKLVIGTNRAKLPSGKSRFRSHLDVSVPGHVPLLVNSSHGKVTLKDTQSRAEIHNAFGEVVVEQVSGDILVENNNQSTRVRQIDGSVTVHSVSGAIEVEDVSGSTEAVTRYARISIRGVEGDVIAQNRFGSVTIGEVSGDCLVDAPGSRVRVRGVGQGLIIKNTHESVRAEEIGLGLEIETRYSDRVHVAGVLGAVSIRAHQTAIQASRLGRGITVRAVNSEVDVMDVEGPFDIISSFRRVAVRNFQAGGEIQNEFGDVHVIPERQLKGNLSVVNKDGKITLELPSGGAFALDAQALGGHVISEFTPSSGEDHSVLKTVVGEGGREVRLQTQRSSIEVLKQ